MHLGEIGKFRSEGLIIDLAVFLAKLSQKAIPGDVRGVCRALDPTALIAEMESQWSVRSGNDDLSRVPSFNPPISAMSGFLLGGSRRAAR